MDRFHLLILPTVKANVKAGKRRGARVSSDSSPVEVASVGLISLMSLLVGCFLMLAQYAVQLVDKRHELLRVHFLAGLFGKMLPISGRLRGHWALLSQCT